MKGHSHGRKLDKVGQPGSDPAELFLEDVRVPSTNIIGELGGLYTLAHLDRFPADLEQAVRRHGWLD